MAGRHDRLGFGFRRVRQPPLTDHPVLPKDSFAGALAYAHRDVAFEFGSWRSPGFKRYLNKEFQRRTDEASPIATLEWRVQRTLSKLNCGIHTDAIKDPLLPPRLTAAQTQTIDAS